jgi:excisionase family DNA binding protein
MDNSKNTNNAFDLDEMVKNTVESLTREIRTAKHLDHPEVLNVKLAAEFLGLSRSTIYTYVSKRKIPYAKRNGTVSFLRTRLLKWLEEGERQTLDQLAK